MHNIYDYSDYKPLIKMRVKELKTKMPSVTLRKLSAQVPLQYTYLSKVLNNESAHLNEDDLFRLGELLEFTDSEKEFLLLLRAHAVSSSQDRRQYLENKIEDLRNEKLLRAKIQKNVEAQITTDMEYLFDHLSPVIQVAMHIESIRKNPHILCTKLGISEQRLKKQLRILSQLKIIETQPDDPLKVIKVQSGHVHYGKEHPAMRTHQYLMKSAIQARLQQSDESEKHSFLTSFTLSPHDFDKVKREFQTFIQRVEKIVQTSTEEGVYQISFDLFRWL